jgi:hypothetical protein
MKHTSEALSPGRTGAAIQACLADKDQSYALDGNDPNFDDDQDPSLVSSLSSLHNRH